MKGTGKASQAVRRRASAIGEDQLVRNVVSHAARYARCGYLRVTALLRRDGRALKLLTIVDEHTRECVAVDVRWRMRSIVVLDREIFHALAEARVLIRRWDAARRHELQPDRAGGRIDGRRSLLPTEAGSASSRRRDVRLGLSGDAILNAPVDAGVRHIQHPPGVAGSPSDLSPRVHVSSLSSAGFRGRGGAREVEPEQGAVVAQRRITEPRDTVIPSVRKRFSGRTG